jgi:acyl-CoA synthetase (AMP-forming)/AMP-acid ligase II
MKIKSKMRNKMNKKAWLRILEAFLAILIIMGAVLVIISTREESRADLTETVYERQRQVLDVISKNESLREKVISEEYDGLNNFIVRTIPSNWNFTIKICNINDICNADSLPYDRSVYVTETLVSSNLTVYSPKKIRLFVWLK